MKSEAKRNVTVMDTNGASSNTFWYMPNAAWFTNSTAPLGKFTYTFSEDEADSEEERGGSFEGVLAVVGSPTSDGRYLIPDEIGNRDLPLPFMVQTATEQHHAGAEVAGRIESVEYIPLSEFERADEFSLSDITSDQAVVVWATGTFDLSEFAQDAERVIENGAGVSIDLPPDRIAMFDPETLKEIPEEEVDIEAAMMGAYLVGIAGKIAAATIVSIPAFEEASVVLVPGHALVASAYGIKTRNGVLTAAAAGAAPLTPPTEWFYTEEPDVPTPLTVTADGQVYGHLALWNQCHSAFATCERAPRSRTDYSFFHVGEIETEDGDLVPVGRITVGQEGTARGGHASMVLGRKGAMEHYDRTGCVGAFVRAENGKNGIWLSGAVRSDAPAEKIRDLRANPPSGDWRDDELVAVLSVPVPGFAIPRVQALVASAENGDEEVKALIATGFTEDSEDYERIDVSTYRKRKQELAERRLALRAG